MLISNLELSVLDFNFRLKSVFRGVSTQEGVEIKRADPKLSPDILIVGIDDRSLDTYGRWPFPRYTHANLHQHLHAHQGAGANGRRPCSWTYSSWSPPTRPMTPCW